MNTQSNVSLFGNFRQSAAKFVALAFCMLGAVAASAATLNLSVVGVGPNGATFAVPDGYRWVVEEDATKLSVPGVPATPANYSFSFHTSYMPVVAAGRVGTVKTGVVADPDVSRLYTQPLPEVCPALTTCLDASKRYYVSVAAEGFQMGAAPIVFAAGGAAATVYLNQYPVPTAQVSVFAFNDNNPINGAPDLPQETGLAGFTVQLFEAGGTYGQSGGQVTQDGFGNPLGTTYNAAGDVLVRGKGIVLTGPDGTAVIKNLFPAKYTVVIVPPVNTDWHQTSTIEGTRGSDAWVKNNEPSFFQEFGPPGHHVFIGFTKSGCIQGAAVGGVCPGFPAGSGQSITGRIVNIHNSRTPNYAFEKGAPVTECWVGLNETGGGTRALYATRCGKDSRFTIPNVPNGTYELVVWDDPLDMIIGTQTVTVTSAAVAMGDVPVFSWFGRYQGRVFQDIDGTGLPFFAEDFNRPYIKVDPVTGIESESTQTFKAGDLKPAFGEGIANNIRFRDGSIYQSAVTKQDGTFAFTELFPFFNWMIAEIDYARFKATGATTIADAGGVISSTENAVKLWKTEKGSFGSADPAYAYDPFIRLNPQLQETCSADQVAANLDANGKIIDATACFKVGAKYYRTEQGVILLEGMQTFLGQTNHIEWGKQPYAGQLNGPKNENGGIAGIVHYAITRAEDDPRLAAAENWEPGIPRVQVNLYLDCDRDGKIDKPLNNGSGLCAPGGLSGADTYPADLPDIDNFPFCWRDPGSCGLSAGQKGPEDVKRSRTGGTSFSFGDVFQWGGLTADPTIPTAPSGQLHAGLGKTDGWDDSIPTGCIKPAGGAVSNGGIPFAADLDCFDGLYNFNQIRPAVFDGGYAFGRVAGQAELPVLIGAEGTGTYIVEANAPPGYLHQGNGDKNVVFGDSLQASTAALPFECVGPELPVPKYLSLFPGEGNPNFTGAGQTWRKCDMKAVPLLPGTNPAPDFFMFTEAPISGHGVGFILDDTASEFNRFAPTFGEKYAPPHLPISIQDWTGREISRTYSDQFGSYNFLVPSSFTINPPFPSGVMPSMMVSCMNHPGPIVDERLTVVNSSGVTVPNPTLGQKIIDPFFNRKYTQFCYTLQYLPGKTTYLDTPVLPIAAFASVEKNPLDCECQDKTPAIYSANNADATYNAGNNGPWVPAGGGTLTIVSAGAQMEVPNPAYDPAVPGSPKHITRDYSFGSTGGTVKLGTTVVTPSTWNADILTVTVPGTLANGAHQLTITRNDSGKDSVVGLTVHKGGNAPKVVAPNGNIQAVIDAATTVTGDLITIPPGTYNEYLILDKRVRLQGWGANSVGINASKASAGGLAAWRALLNSKATSNPAKFDLLPGQTLGIDTANNEPLLFGAEEGPGILVVGKSANNGAGCANSGFALRIDGLTVTGSDSGGGILASGYNCNLQITNNRVVGNYGTYGGGIRVGHTALTSADGYTNGVNTNVVVDHNWVSQNGASEIASADGGAGGVTLGTGTNGYLVSNNYICGNFSMSDGGGISHVGRSTGTSQIVNNKIYLNQTFNQSADPTGGGVFIGGQIALAGGASDGTGNLTVDRNLIQYNHAGAGAGGGVSIARTVTTDNVVLTNNMIANNVTAYAGGGVAFADVTSNVRLVNNTVADNVSTATNRQSFPPGPKTQSTQQVAGIARISGSNPTLLNNIVWGNKSFTWSITPATFDANGVMTAPESTALAPAATSQDIGVVSGVAMPHTSSKTTADTTEAQIAFVKRISVISAPDADQPVVLPETTILQTALTFDEGGNFINVVMSPLTPWEIVAGANFGTLRSDYHITDLSTAKDAGTDRSATNRVPTNDVDGQTRAVTKVDIGADEVTPAVVQPPPLPTLGVLDNFARGTTGTANAANLGANWSQPSLFGLVAIRVNASQASAAAAGAAYWNSPAAGFGARQAAAFTIANTTLNGDSLVLKATGGSSALPANFIRVQVTGSVVNVQTTSNGGITYAVQGSFGTAFASGDTLTALVDETGTVYVWKNAIATPVGTVTLTGSWTGAGRIGMQLPNGARVDDFKGGTVP